MKKPTIFFELQKALPHALSSTKSKLLKVCVKHVPLNQQVTLCKFYYHVMKKCESSPHNVKIIAPFMGDVDIQPQLVKIIQHALMRKQLHYKQKLDAQNNVPSGKDKDVDSGWILILLLHSLFKNRL